MRNTISHISWITALSTSLVAPLSNASAEPTCNISQKTQDRIPTIICGSSGDTSSVDCILSTTKLNIGEAVIFTALIERCGNRNFAEQTYRGITRTYGAMATMARCVGVNMDIDAIVAEARSKELALAAGRTCPPPQSDAAKASVQPIIRYWQAETDANFWAQITQDLYAEAGVAVDADGNVTEK